jgi:DNA ligase (NAD+)
MEITADKLETLLRKASASYYAGTPQMSDQEFDKLCDELRAMDPDNAFLKEIGAPVQVGAWPKVKHQYVMGSQEKCKTKEEFTKWAADKGPLVITDKLDGSTLVLTYKDGKLVSAATRGDGVEGEEVLENALKMQNVKGELNGFTGVLRGEVILDQATFDKHFAPVGYKNPRNAATGIVREKESTLANHLKVIYFDVIADNLKTECDKYTVVTKLGLKFAHIRGPYSDPEDVWRQFELRTLERPALGFEIDGMVVKMDDLAAQQALGDLNGRPRGQIAIKFEAQTKIAAISDIQWQVGRNGRISPVAILEPVDIGGVTITRCTLNNRDYIKALNVSVGAKVTVARMNDVIPAIINTVVTGAGYTNEPLICPTCKGSLEREGAYLFCPMIDCQGKTIGNLNIWIRATKIKGIGPAVLSALIDLGVDDPAKLMKADREKFHDACKSEKNGDKLYQQVSGLTEMDMATLLYGLNVPHVGEINSRRIAKHFSSMDKLMAASVEELEVVPGVKTTAKAIWFGLDARKSTINELMSCIKITGTSGIGPLSGISMCITGELWAGRDEIHDLMRAKGAEVKTGVSKDLTFLVTDDPGSGSSKNKKAVQYGVKIISGDTLKALLEGQLTPDKL